MMTPAASADYRTLKPSRIDAAAYAQLLETLLTSGAFYGKTSQVAAFHLPNITLVTENMAGPETKRDIKVEDVYLVFDTQLHPNEHLRRAIAKGVSVEWALKIVDEKDLANPDFCGPGLWVVKGSTFKEDYLPTKDPHLFDPNPEAARLILAMTEDTVTPTNWGEDFLIPKDGHLAIREKDVTALAAALSSLRDGSKTAEEALFKPGSEGKTALLDAYGMMPYFLANNYAPVEAKEATKAIRAGYATSPARPLGTPAPEIKAGEFNP